jgi:hypothetical protein
VREIEERYEDEFWQPFPRARQLPEFYRYKIHEEADEATPYLDPAIPITPEYLQEQADLFLTWMGLNRSMGVSYADSYASSRPKTRRTYIQGRVCQQTAEF